MTSESTLTRLRRSNPVVQTPRLDADELFARITALPGDDRLAGRPVRRRGRRAAVVVVAMVVVALLASAGYAVSNWVGAEPVKPKVTKHEYLEAQSRLTLPPGATWPTLHVPAYSVTSPGAGGGFAVGIARNAWECYWAHAIRSGDVAAQRQAHAQLTSLLAHNTIVAPANASENWSPPHSRSVPFQVYADDGGFQYLQATYAAAVAGHPSRLIQSCRANAPR
jgi:hypothetical protein